jgi:endoglucanase
VGQHTITHRVLVACVALAALLVPALSASAAPGTAGGAGRGLDPSTQFYVRNPDHAAIDQIAALTSSGDKADAALLRTMIQTPQAVWLTGGTPMSVQQQVKQVVQQAAGKGTVPVLVAYNIPGRDCSQYSAGGAPTADAYKAWIDGFVAGLGSQKAVVLVEPDGLANLPSDCGFDVPGGTSDKMRIGLISYAAHAMLKDPNAAIYLDAGHSAWHSVGDMAARLVQAGVQDVQGFFLNVSNYEPTPNQVYYGTWISDCITLSGYNPSYSFGGCPNQYWNGGPATGWNGVPMSSTGVWSEGASQPDLNTSGIDSRYQQMLNGATPTTHFVIDTGRNGQGPWVPTATYPDPQTWCNPPGRGVGLLPTANTGNSLVDAYLWVKVPGESDGQCYRGTSGPLDPARGVQDPAAGQWFSDMALELARNANPPLSQS